MVRALSRQDLHSVDEVALTPVARCFSPQRGQEPASTMNPVEFGVLRVETTFWRLLSRVEGITELRGQLEFKLTRSPMWARREPVVVVVVVVVKNNSRFNAM